MAHTFDLFTIFVAAAKSHFSCYVPFTIMPFLLGRSATLVALLLLTVVAVITNADEDATTVTCGSFIKLTNPDTGYDLSSEQKTLGGGSGQQIITFVKNSATHNTLWWIRPAHDPHSDDDREYAGQDTCQLGQPIKCGTTIRLTHQDTLKNLHSHGYKSPLSNQQEVSGYGTGDGNGDGGDNWTVVCETAKAVMTYWYAGQPIRLLHVDTGKYLGTGPAAEYNEKTCGANCPIFGHYEAFGRTAKDKFSLLQVNQGVHLSQ